MGARLTHGRTFVNKENLKRLMDYYRKMNFDNLEELRGDCNSHMTYTASDCMAAVISRLDDGRDIISSHTIRAFLDVLPEVAGYLYFMQDQGDASSHIPKFQRLTFDQQKEVILATLERLELHDGMVVRWVLPSVPALD